MRIIVLAALIAIGCGSSGTPGHGLVGNWLSASADGTTAVAATFTNQGTYVLAQLQLTSGTTANGQVETGTFTATETQFTSTPEDYTCPEPDPVATVSYSFDGATLQVDNSDGII